MINKTHTKSTGKGNEGFILVTALLFMAVLAIIGAAATYTSIFETQVSTNDEIHKMTFYEADGGTHVGTEVLEQNIACITGFKLNYTTPSPDDELGSLLDGTIFVDQSSINLWQNFSPTTIPGNTHNTRDFYYPVNAAVDEARTNFNVAGSTKLTTGAAIQMAAGYQGKGRGIGSGGAYLFYDLYSSRLGQRNWNGSVPQSVIHVQWRHTIGQEDDCIY